VVVKVVVIVVGSAVVYVEVVGGYTLEAVVYGVLVEV